MATTESKLPSLTFDENKNSNFHKFAACGDFDNLKKFIDEGIGLSKIDGQNNYGWTPLMLAARNGHQKMVKLLIEHRADATKLNQYGGTVFLMSVASGDLEIVTLLLEHLLTGGISRPSMEMMLSPVALSILFEHDHIFMYLLERQFSANALFNGLTPLMFAAVIPHPTFFMDNLIYHGADLSYENANYETAQDILNRKNCVIPLPQNGLYQAPIDCVQYPTPLLPPPMFYVNSLPVQVSVPVQQQQSPFITYFEAGTPIPLTRKSSNTATPTEMFTPYISPVGMHPQVFFPPDFTSSHYQSPYLYGSATPSCQDFILSPMILYNTPVNDQLNVRISHVSDFYQA